MQKNNLEMLWLWGELPQATKVSFFPLNSATHQRWFLKTRNGQSFFFFQEILFHIPVCYKSLKLHYYIISFFFFFNTIRLSEDAVASCIPSKSL